MNRFKVLISISLIWIFLKSTHAFSDPIFYPWINHSESFDDLKVSIQAHYFKTQRNYGASGDLISLPNSPAYERIQNLVTLTQGVSNRNSLYSQLGWAFIQEDSTQKPYFSTTDQSLGFNSMSWKSEQARIHSQFQISIPYYQNPRAGNGSFDITGGFFLLPQALGLHSAKLTSQFGLGYTFRSHGFSSSLPWSILIGLYPHRSRLFFEFIALGDFSLKTDQYSKNRATFRNNLGNQESLIRGAMNPSLIQLQLKAGYELNPMTRFYLNAQQSIWGQMSPKFHSFSIEVESQLGSGASGPAPSTHGEKSNSQALIREGMILDTHAELGIVKLNLGALDGVQVGDLYQIFSKSKEKTSSVNAKVTHMKAKESVLEIITPSYWRDEGYQIQAGDLARRVN